MTEERLETGLIGGVEKRHIEIAGYDPDWPNKFEKHAKIIAGAIGGSILYIEHIGSTSVPGLAVKPIIDILVVVADSSSESTYLPQLEAAGYVLRVREPNELTLARHGIETKLASSFKVPPTRSAFTLTSTCCAHGCRR